MRRSYIYVLIAAFLAGTFFACKKSNDPVGSPYIRDAAGNHSFHYTQSGYTGAAHSPFTNTRDTVMTIGYVNDAYLSFNSDKFRYDVSPSDSILTFYDEQLEANTKRYDITYNRYTHEIAINRNYNVGTGNGTTMESWISY
ncbi:MAG: hypothetical protein K0Q79_3402 [Flavipsychrobacter sp.]|jgi:hypothetical protein|nr:hypothetical protein [Flavipsychrobacter sp.]